MPGIIMPIMFGIMPIMLGIIGIMPPIVGIMLHIIGIELIGMFIMAFLSVGRCEDWGNSLAGSEQY